MNPFVRSLAGAAVLAALVSGCSTTLQPRAPWQQDETYGYAEQDGVEVRAFCFISGGYLGFRGFITNSGHADAIEVEKPELVFHGARGDFLPDPRRTRLPRERLTLAENRPVSFHGLCYREYAVLPGEYTLELSIGERIFRIDFATPPDYEP